MKGLVITTENKMQVREFGEPAYETIGKAVGGWIEVVHPKGLPDPFCMVVNEEGLLHGLPINLFGCILYDTVRHGNPIVGNIVILKEGFTTPGERLYRAGRGRRQIPRRNGRQSKRRRHQVGKRGAIMAKFYFTYGTDGQPFFGGWTEVEAPDAHAACAAFRAYHPDKTEGLVNCSSIYDEEQFKLTEMYRESNFGFRCHEIITLRREAATN